MKISIIIICDRIKENKLNRLFHSIKPQLSQRNTEVLLIHEAKTPCYLPSFPLKVRYCPVPPGRGIPFNRNQGIKSANGDIILFIDDDCWVQENWLRALLKPLEDRNIMAVTGGTIVPTSHFLADCISALGFPGGGSLGFAKVWKVSEQGFTNHLAVGNCALRRELFELVGYFDESLKHGAEDTEFSYRMEKAGIPIKYSHLAFAYHESRGSIRSFVRWHIRRGRANYHFRKKVQTVKYFVMLRFWSAKNILKENLTTPRLPFIAFLLALSFFLQQAGYLSESINDFRFKTR